MLYRFASGKLIYSYTKSNDRVAPDSTSDNSLLTHYGGPIKVKTLANLTEISMKVYC